MTCAPPPRHPLLHPCTPPTQIQVRPARAPTTSSAVRTWKAAKEWNVHRGVKSRNDAIGRGGRAAGRLRACGGGDSGGRDSGGGRTCSARTSCRQSSPTLKMQACTASRLAAPLPSPSAAWSSLSTLKATRMGTCAPAPPPPRPPPEPPLQAQGRDLPWVEGRRSHLGGGLHGGGGGGQQRHHPGGGVCGQKQVVPRRTHAPQHLSRRRLAPRFVHLPSNAIDPHLRPWRPCVEQQRSATVSAESHVPSEVARAV